MRNYTSAFSAAQVAFREAVLEEREGSTEDLELVADEGFAGRNVFLMRMAAEGTELEVEAMADLIRAAGGK